MASLIQKNFRARKTFAKLKQVIEIPNLIDIQKRSYDKFLQIDIPIEKREDIGLQGVFKSVFPIKDFSETSSLEFVSYNLEKPKYDVDECRARGMTFAAPIKVVIRLVVWDVNEETGVQSIRDVKEQEVYFGEIPLMTDSGTFIINGTERVIVSQLHRSPGVFFDHDKGKTHSSGKLLYSARVIPYRGSWLDFEFDHKDVLYVRIDRRRKLYATVLLRALGYSTEELLNYFYDTETIHFEPQKKYARQVNYELLVGQRATRDIKHPKTKEVLVKKNRKFTKGAIRKLQESGVEMLPIDMDELAGKVSARDVIDDSTGEVLLQCNEELNEAKLDELRERGVERVEVLFIDNLNVGPYLRNTLLIDKLQGPDEAVREIYRRLRPGDQPALDSAQTLFQNLFFNAERYDLSRVGRLKLNYKFKIDEAIETQILTKRDILETVRYLIELRNGRGVIDDIDHLGNRRVRAVGELMENQYRIGLVRMERAIKERMSMSQEIETLMPHDLINAKPVSAVVKEYFGSSQLSQFMDQTNPLSEVTHKRRLSALGPGGLTRERAGFEVRDVHGTHYGRICPIETPEGPNIGLISSLSSYARVNRYGFIETPYRKVIDNKVTDEVVYLSAMEEAKHTIAQANAELKKDRTFVEEIVSSRRNGDFLIAPRDQITLMDVSPKQLVSVAASLIPFLENDDANRALMGSNMQRQAVPLIQADAPLVGTGMEETVARDSGAAIAARRSGIVDQVDAARIVVRATGDLRPGESGVDIYTLMKFQRSNQNTCINQRPLVKVGDTVEGGEIIADGPSTQFGELALGRNVLVAFMPWNGYNYEDSILISERIVKDDVFTSIHIEEFEVMARDTKLGPEDITRDIPNVGEEALRNLDEAGIVYIGAEVEPGDILCGKITPKGESPMTPEEKLLRAIFGEKAADVRDTSLKLPPGVQGTVVEVRVFNRHGIDIDDRTRAIQTEEKERLKKDADDERGILNRTTFSRLKEMLLKQTATAAPKGVKKGATLDDATLEGADRHEWWKIAVKDDKRQADIEALKAQYDEAANVISRRFEDRVEKIERGDELPPGVLKMVKVFVAVKRKLQPGDKMAGRHGNKGVISRILPIEDMPFLEDGTPVDIVLNPLGVPSRMNVGQIFETHLGWAARGLGQQIQEMLDGIHERGKDLAGKDVKAVRAKLKDIYGAHYNKELDALSEDDLHELASNLVGGVPMGTPVFDGAREADVSAMLEKAGLATSGQVTLFDGRSGEAFDRQVTVGYIYMLKLHHLVDDKIHARSIGPYSLVTQQPLGGKAQFGGQRFGEMEVWALEAYGAAHILQEMLTVKSDDVIGRTKVYEAIVRGDDTFEAGIPESFNVLVKEMRSLGLNVELNSIVDTDADQPTALAAE